MTSQRGSTVVRGLNSRSCIRKLATKLVRALHCKPDLSGDGVHASPVELLHDLHGLVHQFQSLLVGRGVGEEVMGDQQPEVDLDFGDGV